MTMGHHSSGFLCYFNFGRPNQELMWIQAIGEFCLALSILIFYPIFVVLYVDGISRRTNTVDKIDFLKKNNFYLY